MATYNAFFDGSGRLSIVTNKPGTLGDEDGPYYAGVSPVGSAVGYTGYEIELDDDMLREQSSGRSSMSLARHIEGLVRDNRGSLTPAQFLSPESMPPSHI